MSFNRKQSLDNKSKNYYPKVESDKVEEIYFSKTKKYNYMKQIIDKYFDDVKQDKSKQNP